MAFQIPKAILKSYTRHVVPGMFPQYLTQHQGISYPQHPDASIAMRLISSGWPFLLGCVLWHPHSACCRHVLFICCL